MATNTSIKNQLANRTNTVAPSQPTGFKGIVNSDSVKQRFDEVLKDKAPQFLSSMINMYSSDTYLQKCEPMSIISSCMVAATLDLPVDKNLGYAWVVPYSGKASFQLGYKGYIQLALRTGQYKAINVVEVHEGELIEWNPLTEELQIDFTKKKSDAIIGYAGYFKLVNGFEKTVYWSKEQIENHRKKFSKSDFGWKKDFDAMAKKTVLRNMLSKWGILSIEMQKAYSEDVSDPVMKDITDDVVMDFSTVETQDSEEGSSSQPEIVFEQ
ncbi:MULTISPECIES: recombinase RecT [Bacillus cereus group]|uniref:recombinase RecT n=1 Tax=Bacillus cereus group TaxID=86661 RepID=UPI002E1C6900|nr:MULTISPECIES: recombinase RecT [Bacillus cereus group]MED1436916.1 recombinase RecT [Bacillus mycoides]MED1477747.1 recombinase RecT [Bacillus pseudomycoides]